MKFVKLGKVAVLLAASTALVVTLVNDKKSQEVAKEVKEDS